MSGANGQIPGGVPLNLTPAQRKACLTACGLGDGWLLLTMEEMMTMRRVMVTSDNENKVLRAELRKRIGKEAVKVLKKIVEGADKFVPFPTAPAAPAPGPAEEPEKPKEN